MSTPGAVRPAAEASRRRCDLGLLRLRAARLTARGASVRDGAAHIAWSDVPDKPGTRSGTRWPTTTTRCTRWRSGARSDIQLHLAED